MICIQGKHVHDFNNTRQQLENDITTRETHHHSYK